jgi:hypothetical protein
MGFTYPCCRNVTFSGHTGNHGFAIAAYGNVSIQLKNVTFTNNHGSLNYRRHKAPCSNTSRSSSIGGTIVSPYDELPACFAPELPSSLIYVQESFLQVEGNSSFNHNSAGALVAAKGGSHSLVRLGTGTIIKNNAAGWLLVADSWQYDPKGQGIITSPRMQLIRDESAASGRKVVQGQEELLREAHPYDSYKLGQRNLPMSVNDSDYLISSRSSGAWKAVKSFIWQAPKGVTPMRVQLEGVKMFDNVVEGGLLWLRLVQTSMAGVVARNNYGGFPVVSNSSIVTSSDDGISSFRVMAKVAASLLEGSGSPCEPPVYDALIRVVGPDFFSMRR